MKFKEVPQAFGNRVIVKVNKVSDTTESGIIITSSIEPFAAGTIVSVPVSWNCSEDEEEEYYDQYIHVGEEIIFKSYLADAEPFYVDKDKYIFLEESHVLAKL